MEKPLKGDLIVIPFPFTDLSGSKRRPALVVARLTGDDLIVCQITSQIPEDSYFVELPAEDILEGALLKSSYIRPNRLFTIDSHMVLYRAGRISEAKMNNTLERLRTIFEFK